MKEAGGQGQAAPLGNEEMRKKRLLILGLALSILALAVALYALPEVYKYVNPY